MLSGIYSLYKVFSEFKTRDAWLAEAGEFLLEFGESLVAARAVFAQSHQKWFEDEKHNEYHCPLGKRLVDFAVESHFSRIAMYIKGRIWLEDKTKIAQPKLNRTLSYNSTKARA